MPEHPLILRYAARSNVGLVRAKNDDSAYVGQYLAVVADGMGGHAGGDVASASTVLDLIHLDHAGYKDDAGTHLADEIQSANSLLSELVHVDPKLAGMGTTVTALLLSGNRLAYAHIGDSRAYRLKDGVFAQMSTDHTFVQRMIDEGRMTEAEAEVHPHKNVLMRVLGDVDASPELDLKYFDTEVGERWLLCSDGLNFVRHEMIEEVIRHTKNLATAADTLIELTLAAGSPDNVTVVVFDVVESNPDDTSTAALETVSTQIQSGDNTRADDLELDDQELSVLSSRNQEGHKETVDTGRAPSQKVHAADVVLATDTSTNADTGTKPSATEPSDGHGADRMVAEGSGPPSNDDVPGELDAHIRAAAVRHELSLRPHELVGAALTANEEGKIPRLAHAPATVRAAQLLTHKPADAAAVLEENEVSLPRVRFRPLVVAIVGALVVISIVAAGWVAYAWTQTQYYVGVSNGNVAIFKGVSQNLGPISLSSLQRETGVTVSSLPNYSQQLVKQTMPTSSLSGAEQIISDLQLGTGSSMPPCEPSDSATAPSGTSSASPSESAVPPSPAVAASASPPSTTNAPSATPTCTPGGGR